MSSLAPPDSRLCSEAALAYASALALAWKNDTSLLPNVMRADSDIETPLWKTKSLAEYEEVLLEFADFFGARATPTLSLLSHAALPDGSVKLSWQLSAEWPSMWRSRINLIGQSVLTFAPSSSPSSPPLVRSVRETWHQKPAEAFFKQVLPKPRDVATFWCSPTAEEIPQPLVQRLGGIEIRKLPPMLALQAPVPSRSSCVSVSLRRGVCCRPSGWRLGTCSSRIKRRSHQAMRTPGRSSALNGTPPSPPEF